MKRIKNISTGLIGRNFKLAKILGGVAKDLYFSKEEVAFTKISMALEGRAETLSEELSQLKGSFLKAGQLLSLYGQDLFPPQLQEILNRMQNYSGYLAWDAIKKQIPEDFLSELRIEQEAFAAASIGQVHQAWKGEQKYALKIQYRNIEQAIELDLKVLRWMLRLIEVLPNDLSLDDVFDEIRTMLLQEIDYKRELEFITEYQTNIDDRYIVPKPNLSYCNDKIICTEFNHGLAVKDAIEITTKTERNRLAKDFFELFFREIFEWKFIQTDAHLGNYLIDQGRWVLLDFGACQKISKEVSDRYRKIILTFVENDFSRFLQFFEDEQLLDWKQSDRTILSDYFHLISEPFQTKNYDWKNSDITQRAMNMSSRMIKGLKFKRIPSEHIFIDRKVLGLFYILKTCKAQGDIIPWQYL